MTTEQLEVAEPTSDQANGSHATDEEIDAALSNAGNPTVLPEPDDTERMPRQGNPRQGVVEILQKRLERVLQPVDDPKPVDWLRDPEYDRLRWAYARAMGRPGGTTTEDEEFVQKLLDELEAIQAASDTPVWPGVNVITRRDLLDAMVIPLPPASSQAASVTTPAFVYVDAVCPVCGIASEIALELGVKLTAEGYSRKLELVKDSKALPHVCGQMRIRDVSPSKPVRGQTAIDFGGDAGDEDAGGSGDLEDQLEAALGPADSLPLSDLDELPF